MTRADLLVSLLKAGAEGDREAFRKAAEALIAEERGKQHHLLAEKLSSVLKQRPSKALPFSSNIAFLPDERARDYVVEVYPKLDLNDLSLSSVNREAISELIEEHFRADLLRSHNIDPRHKILLYGPPGNGKTSLAEAIAESLSLPLMIVKYDAVIGSYLGETASRLRKVFDYCKTIPCVLFLDEFDALAKERGDTHETGEIKRVVSSLLTQIDDLPHYVMVIAASNHPELLDRAVWRRFQLRLSLDAPNDVDIELWAARFINDLGNNIDDNTLKYISKKLSGQSYSEIKEKILASHRRYILNMHEAKFSTLLQQEVGKLFK